VSDIFEEPDDAATPLTGAEKRDLIPTHIAFRSELNAAEQENIARGQDWAERQRKTDLLDEKFIKTLHLRMFGDVWKWAGKYRHSERNIGIDPWKVPMEVRILRDDVKLWIENRESFA
jgi:Fic-DOC domain mobile mystery protein B